MDTLLLTKYVVPPMRPSLVPRPHLVARLSAGMERRCTLVSAPAGSGKTTLVSMWLGQSPSRAAWLSLDESDNDPVRFFRYLRAALEPVAPELGKSVPEPPPSPTPPSLTHFLTALINGIVELSPDPPLILVLDDYHAIQARAIHEGLAFLLDHMPAHMHIVLITRADPPLPLARLRARHQLLEIRMHDLRFAPAEATAFLNQVMGLHLAADDVEALEARTEGWAVGLQMAALALQSTGTLPGGQEAAGSMQAWAGSSRYILEYLVEEVLGRQPGEVQAFLLRTSILDRLSGPLCDAVWGQAGAGQRGQKMLEQLERANLFLVPLDPQREWYRYHHLFAELLQQRLRQGEPGLAIELHRRASEWYSQHGWIEEAIEHALHGEDPERAAWLVEQAAEAILMRGELVTLTGWFDELPDEAVRQRPLLCLYEAGVRLLNGEPQARIQPCLEAAAGHGVADAAADGTTILRALLALWQGDVDQSVALGQQALASLPEENLFWRGIVTGNMGIAYLCDGRQADRAAQMLAEAAGLGERAGNVMGAVIALCNLAELRMVQGQLQAAKSLYDRALALAVDERGQSLPIGGMAAVGLAVLLLEWDEPEAAERLLAAALAPGSEKLSIWAVDGYLALARLRRSQGKDRAAQEAIEQAQRAAATTGATELDDWSVAAAQTRLWIAQGKLDVAVDWARRCGLADGPNAGRDRTLYALYELEHLALAELRLAQDRPGDALAVLAALLERSRALQRTSAAIETLILTALAHRQRNAPDRALDALAQALALARPGRYVRTFVDRGPAMADLLRRALAQGIAVEDAQRLLAAFGPAVAPMDRGQAPVEPLSERERQVLRLLAASLSSAEIGEILYISANTVRFHLKNIYAKLNVHNREDAVQRARELGLL